MVCNIYDVAIGVSIGVALGMLLMNMLWGCLIPTKTVTDKFGETYNIRRTNRMNNVATGLIFTAAIVIIKAVEFINT